MVKKLVCTILLVLALTSGSWAKSDRFVWDPWCQMMEEDVWTRGMKVWSYKPGILIVSFLPPEWPYPTDWEAVEKEATARAKALGYGVKNFKRVDYDVAGTKVHIRHALIETKPLPPANILLNHDGSGLHSEGNGQPHPSGMP